MKEILLKNRKAIENAEKTIGADRRKRFDGWTAAFYLGAFAGIAAALAGLLLGALSYLGVFGDRAEALNQAGNLLIVAAFALLMLAAHALDRISEIKKRAGALKFRDRARKNL